MHDVHYTDCTYPNNITDVQSWFGLVNHVPFNMTNIQSIVKTHNVFSNATNELLFIMLDGAICDDK